jgi:hypothetical protein
LARWPAARLAEQHLYPRPATVLLSVVAGVLAACSTMCLALLMAVGTAQLPGNPLPDGWSDEEAREAVPYDGVTGRVAIPALGAGVVACVLPCGVAARLAGRAAVLKAAATPL